MFWTLVIGAGVVTAIALTRQHRQTRAAHANVIAGRAMADTTLRAPLSGRECVYWTVMLTKPTDSSFARSESRSTIVGLESTSGERIQFAGDSRRYALSSHSPSETRSIAKRDMAPELRALVGHEGDDDVVFEVSETSIPPSSTVYVTGTRTGNEVQVDAIFDAPPRPADVRVSAR